MSMVRDLARRAAQVGDRLLDRAAPRITAEAVCGGYVFCCKQVSQGRVEEGTRRVDPEHGGFCTDCVTNGIRC